MDVHVLMLSAGVGRFLSHSCRCSPGDADEPPDLHSAAVQISGAFPSSLLQMMLLLCNCSPVESALAVQ
jgi:hypothetical protein